jgi:hypothetical protein
MQRRIAAFIIAPMWHEFMEYALEKYPASGFVPPSPDPEYDSLPFVLRGEWNANPGEGVHEILHWINKDNPRGGRPANPARDPQYHNWEYPVQLWALGVSASSTPTSGGFQILSPQAGAQIPFDVPISINAFHPYPQNVMQVIYYLNDQAIGSSNTPPYGLTHAPTIRGPVVLKAVAQTITGIEEYSVPFTVQ